MVLYSISLTLKLLLISCYTQTILASGNLSCYECEIVDRERQMTLWPCDLSSGPWQKLEGCKACIKIEETQRIDFRKPRWGQQYHQITTVSRLCLRKFEPMFSDYCFETYGSGSAQKRCYCSTNFCNFGIRNLKISLSLLLFMLGLSFGSLVK